MHILKAQHIQLLLTLVMAFSGETLAQGKLAADPWQSVRQLMESGQWEKAEIQARILLKKYPAQAEGHYLLGFILGSQKNFDPALESLQQATRIEPRNPIYLFALASAFAEVGNLKVAESEFKELLAVQPNSVPARYALAHVYYGQRKDSAAIRECREVLRMEPRHLPAHLLLGELYYQTNDHSASKRIFEKSLQIQATPEAHQGLARVLSLNPEENHEAIGHLKQSLELRPKDLHALTLLATLYSQTQRNPNAIEIYREILQLNPEAVEAMVSLGRLLSISGQEEQGAQVLGKAAALRQQLAKEEGRATSIKNALLRANDLAKEDRLLEALQKVDEAIALDGRNGDAFALRARLLLFLKQVPQAAESIEKAIDCSPLFAPHYCLLALVRTSQGRKQDAVAAYQRALVLDPYLKEVADGIKQLEGK
ncbi:MAG: tetratricopeptide repeat protein [Acidobacteria bacterium]|nr:tetratricopeptide repeat protein [Acidobacteriota bacterium]